MTTFDDGTPKKAENMADPNNAGQPRRYRWLTEGETYRYGPKLGKGDDTRRGHPCTVVTLPRPGCIGNVLVRFEDGHQAVAPAGVLRKVTR